MNNYQLDYNIPVSAKPRSLLENIEIRRHSYNLASADLRGNGELLAICNHHRTRPAGAVVSGGCSLGYLAEPPTKSCLLTLMWQLYASARLVFAD